MNDQTTFQFKTYHGYIGYTAVPTSILYTLIARERVGITKQQRKDLLERLEEFAIQGTRVVSLPSGQESFNFDLPNITENDGQFHGATAPLKPVIVDAHSFKSSSYQKLGSLQTIPTISRTSQGISLAFKMKPVIVDAHSFKTQLGNLPSNVRCNVRKIPLMFAKILHCSLFENEKRTL